MAHIYTETLAYKERTDLINQIHTIAGSMGLIPAPNRKRYLEALNTLQDYANELYDIRSGKTGLKVEVPHSKR
jgi:hypothetical protein